MVRGEESLNISYELSSVDNYSYSEIQSQVDQMAWPGNCELGTVCSVKT